MEMQPRRQAAPIAAILWDFGGVITQSPFAAFAAFEAARGLPAGFIRGVNARNPDANAWARLERSEIDPDTFDALFAAESEALGHRLRGAEILPLLAGTVRPEMVRALTILRGRFKLACLTNNVKAGHGAGMARTPEQAAAVAEVLALFDRVFESSAMGSRKPDPVFYETACRELGVRPDACVFLDDLGINLKPARAMGMHTIKVETAAAALAELSDQVGIDLT